MYAEAYEFYNVLRKSVFIIYLLKDYQRNLLMKFI